MKSTGSIINGGISFGGVINSLILKKRKDQVSNVLLVFDRNPYDGRDVTWNGLRLVEWIKNTDNIITF